MNPAQAYRALMMQARMDRATALRELQRSHDTGRPIATPAMTLWPVHGTDDIAQATWKATYSPRGR